MKTLLILPSTILSAAIGSAGVYGYLYMGGQLQLMGAVLFGAGTLAGLCNVGIAMKWKN